MATGDGYRNGERPDHFRYGTVGSRHSDPGDGVALSSIFQGATDVDTGSSLRGYAVTSAAANGTTNWQYSTNGGTTWTDFPAVTADSALLLAPSTLVRWEGTAGTNTALSVVAVDNTNTAGFETNVDTTPNGGSTAFSANVATLAANASVTPPVLLDLNHDGVIAYSQITADMNGDGVADLSSWVAAEDGLLFWDKHGDGSLTDRHQFAFAEFGAGRTLPVWRLPSTATMTMSWMPVTRTSSRSVSGRISIRMAGPTRVS